MTTLPRDENRVKVIAGVLDSDRTSVQAVKVDSTSHRLYFTLTGTDGVGNTPIAPRDEDRVPVFMGVSSADGVTPVPIYADSNGRILI